ncbi:M48 family metallopeptidase [Methylococcus sp. EFPC2]|uniref:M48 family metallopeptidase n=1 Tax=Methylococcus sp. EFPC2 TaxID=2812648 RepID=UPI001966E6CA|nr:SprT family zinc-dependent metalloprotease [Methylococcus sp. EFPC2]QSA97161.1 M48 family metallopeptidase [Methylococcus sp. EFPC2]
MEGVTLRRSARAKYLRLVVKPELVELVVPAGVSERQAKSFLEQHRTWLETQRREMEKRVGQRPVPVRFTEHPTIPWQGRDLPLKIEDIPGKRLKVAVDDSVRISIPSFAGDQRDAWARHAFKEWARRWLRGQVQRSVERHAPKHGLQPREIRIKAMKTRWGSCGPSNDININWLLALAPESVLEYVVVHELCHIRERNHSPRFWALVADHLPRWQGERRWLKTHGLGLLKRFP